MIPKTESHSGITDDAFDCEIFLFLHQMKQGYIIAVYLQTWELKSARKRPSSSSVLLQWPNFYNHAVGTFREK